MLPKIKNTYCSYTNFSEIDLAVLFVSLQKYLYHRILSMNLDCIVTAR